MDKPVMRLSSAAISLIALAAVPERAFPQPQPRSTSMFDPIEATISEIHAALASRNVTCAQVIEAHLRRIDAYDDRGPALNALISINPNATETAAAMDQLTNARDRDARPLHCIPVILKDNFDTADMPTTGGAVTLSSSVPLRDAFVVRKLRAAGAVIVAKANMTELALGGSTVSSLGGQTRNPYDLTRTPGGSSGGTGAAIAASFGVLGTGSDTGQSVRSPASAQNLVGLRPTRGLISRSGIIPASTTQDEAGPIARTVADAALMLDVMAGYDPDDPVTAFGAHRIPHTYSAFLDRSALKGARIGVLTEFFGNEPVHQDVNAVAEQAIEIMSAAGASMVRVTSPALDRLTADLQLTSYEIKPAFDRYLAALGPRAPVRTLDEFIARGEFHPSIAGTLEAQLRVIDGLNDSEYKNRLLRRQDLRQWIMKLLADHRLDAILYPHQRRLVVPIGEEQIERNGVLSNSSGFPAITFPAGFSPVTATAPLGVPVGLELLGPEWSEPKLLALAFAFEQAAALRRIPASTPSLLD
jgi:Asp-tRNA(Asn)/Glu-tRNA(Gln) amidotransferase A subunit family amidase